MPCRMSTTTTTTMKVRAGDGGLGGDMSPTSGYPTGSMVRSRPKLPKMEPRSTTLSPERQAAPVPEQRPGALEDLERDLDTLKNTDFASKYSRRPRASGTNSPTGSSRAMSPTHPGHGHPTIRRIESLRMKLVKVKESQDRAEAASRQLKSIPRRRSGVVQRPSDVQREPVPFQSDNSRRMLRDSQSAESITPPPQNSPTGVKDASQTEHGSFVDPSNNRTSTQPTGSVPMTPSVINDQHYQHNQRAWSEPNYHSSSRQGMGDDDDDADISTPIRWKQTSLKQVPGGEGISHVVSQSNSNNQHSFGRNQKKTLTFSSLSNSPEDSLEESTPSEAQSKTSSSSTLKDTFEIDDDPPKTVSRSLSRSRPMVPGLEQMSLLGGSPQGRPSDQCDNALVITNRDSPDDDNKHLTQLALTQRDHIYASRPSGSPAGVKTSADTTNELSQRLQGDLSHSSMPRSGTVGTKDGDIQSLNRSVQGLEEEGVGHGSNDRREDSLLDAYIPRHGVEATQQVDEGSPSGDNAAAAAAASGSTPGATRAGHCPPPTGKMANGRYLTHPLSQEPSSLGDQGCGRSVDSNGLLSLHDTPEQPAPVQREPTSQVRTGPVVESSPGGAMHTSSLEQTTGYGDEVETLVLDDNEVDKLERRNGKSMKQKSKSDPSGDKRKETHNPSTIGGSRAQSTSELNKTDQGRDFETKHVGNVMPKSSELMIKDVLEMKRNLDSKLKADRCRPSVFNKNTKVVTEEHRRASSGEAPADQEVSTAPSSPQTQSPTSTLQRPNATSATYPSSALSSPRRPMCPSSLSRSVSSASTLHSGNKRPQDLAVRCRPPISDLLMGMQQQQRSTDRCFGSTLSLMDTPAKEKRELIVEELVETEQQYVETLQRLVDTYMIPMKTQGFLDSKLVDDIFYKINEISTHHAMFLAFLEQALQRWDNSCSTIGDVIQSAFSRETVIENYVSFIENFPRAEKVLDELINKSTFQRFLEQCERETRSKLPLKAQIVKPAQRIPRYELLLRRLIENTPRDHPDYEQLLRAEGAIHEVALRINSVKESKNEEILQETLRTLEFLLVTDLVAPERLYHRHDMVQVLSRKDQCCIWLFSDLAVLTCIKRKSGPVNRRSTLLLKSPTGQDFVENVKHKVWMKVPLDDVEIVKGAAPFSQKQLVDREQLDDDLALMTQISDLSRKLKGPHQCLDDAIHEMLSQINKQLSEHQLKPPPPDTCRVQLMATTHEGVTSITVVFPSPEKKLSWEGAFIEVKQKLATLSDGKPPEFLQALQITKTRAGMQFSCAAPIEGLNASQQRDVWVCNSDGYVGHMCLLSLQPEPIVTLNTPVPGCNSRILCICAVPAFHVTKRKGSQHRQSKVQQTPSTSPVTIHVESFDGNDDGDESLSDMSSSTSDQGSDDDHDDTTLHINTGVKTGGRSRSPSLSRSESGREGLLQDPYKSTMWLGTEDGCIHIFLCTDNIKTTKNKVKVQQNAGVLCIVHVDHKVFVSLDNGELVVYRRSQDGVWDMSVPDTVSIGNATCPVTKMLPVAGRLWCACQNNIIVLNPATLCQEFQFAVSVESKRTIQCLASSGQGVWVAGQSSSKVLLYHATTYEHLLEVSITQAVAQKLQTADDIIRQHKTACLRITALLACKDLLWIGTSAGVVLTLVMPKVSASTTRSSLSQPSVTGLVHGHTGHVRFLTSVEMPCTSKRGACSTMHDSPHMAAQMSRRASVSLHMLTMATRMLVISGGDGYEDFRTNSSNEAAGRDDSTNHLLLWQV